MEQFSSPQTSNPVFVAPSQPGATSASPAPVVGQGSSAPIKPESVSGNSVNVSATAPAGQNPPVQVVQLPVVQQQPMVAPDQQPTQIVYQQPQTTVAVKTEDPAAAAHPRNVYVASLPLDFTDAQLEQMFSPFGRVLSAKVQYDHKTKMGKGYGFILYDNSASADLAVQNMMSAVVNGQRIQVRKAKANTKTSINAAANTQQPTGTVLVQQPQQIVIQQPPQQVVTNQQGQVLQVLPPPALPVLASPQVINTGAPVGAPVLVNSNGQLVQQQQPGIPTLAPANGQLQQQLLFTPGPAPQYQPMPQPPQGQQFIAQSTPAPGGPVKLQQQPQSQQPVQFASFMQ